MQSLYRHRIHCPEKYLDRGRDEKVPHLPFHSLRACGNQDIEREPSCSAIRLAT